MNQTAAPAVSVVVPVYNEAGNAAPLCEEIRAELSRLGHPFEIIFVNDGSRDTTLDELCRLSVGEPRLRILDLDGNFGEAAALCAGFRAARGDLVVTLDGDGQNDPRDIIRLLEPLEHNGYRVVSGWRQERQEGLFLRVLPSRIANRLIAAVTRIPVHDNGCGLKAYRRAVVQNACLPRGMNRFMPAIFGVTAKEVAEVPVSDRRRQHGKSHYGVSRTLVVMRDLLALRFIIAAPRASEPVAAALTAAGILGSVGALWRGNAWITALAVLVTSGVALVWWNLRRFNRAQRSGVFRVRYEYSAAVAPAVCSKGPCPPIRSGEATCFETPPEKMGGSSARTGLLPIAEKISVRPEEVASFQRPSRRPWYRCDRTGGQSRSKAS